mgnify:FL=1|jgi:hypothetical protein
MQEHHTYENGLKYRPDYKWPEKGTERDCPRCNDSLELVDDLKTYFGKPWWCVPCQWQFSEEDLDADNESAEKNG